MKMDFERIEIGLQIIVRKEYKDFREEITRFRTFYRPEDIPKLINDSLGNINREIDRRFPYPPNVSMDDNKEMELLKGKYQDIFREYAERYAWKVVNLSKPR